MVPNLGGHAKELRDLSHASLPVSGFDNKTETEKKKKKASFCQLSVTHPLILKTKLCGGSLHLH